MTSITNLVASLELSKKLDMKLDTQFYWYPKPKVLDGGKVVINGWKLLMGKNARTYGVNIKIPAPTASELGEVLPNYVYTYFTDGHWHARYAWGSEHGELHYTTEKTMVNAMAKMLIYLKEQGLL